LHDARELAYADEIIGIERADPVDQFIADFRPVPAGGCVTDVVPHAARPRREYREIGAALALNFELRVFKALPDLVIADPERPF